MRSTGVTPFAFVLGAAACFPAAPSTSPADADRASSPASASRRPFVVNWAPTDRTALETRAQEGPVVIRWDATTREADVLGRCRLAADPYRFVPSSHASQTMTSTTDLEVGANFPFAGPVNLGLMLQKHGKITVEYHSIGEYRLALDRAAAEDLTGDCSGATHIIASMSVGAFEFFAGDAIGANAEANVPTAAGVTAGGNRSHENLDRGGDPAACDAASRKSTEPPDRCDSVVAIELMALERNSPFVVGERWEGHYECGRRKATSAFEITELADDGTVDGVIHFDYADVVGEFVARGKPDAAGAMTLTFVEWRKQPAGYDPITPSGAVDAARGEFRGKLSEPGCGDFVYVRRPAG